MGTHHRYSVALALLIIGIGLAQAADKCRTGCHGITPNVYKYQEGTTYKYDFEGNVEVSLSGAEQQQTSTKVKATVLLSPLKDCQQLIRLQNVQVIGHDAKKYPSQDDLKKAVRLVFHDGHVEDEICTEPNDSQNSLNIKRAIISLFQAATKHNTETDVFGVCPTTFSSNKEGGSIVIRKTRDLNRCGHRESIAQDFIATSFNQHSQIKSSPLLSGEYVAEQKIKNGLLENVVVTEHYLYKPFSNGQSGAKASVTTKLHLVGQSKENMKSKQTEPRTILFENPHLVNTPKSNVDNLLKALNKALESSTAHQVVQNTAARNFAALVNTLRVTKKDDVLAVYGSVKAGAGVKDKNAAKKLFLEALFRAGTGDSIEVSIELFKNREIPAEEQKLFFLSLSFVKHASSQSLNTASSLLDQPNLPREAYLGVGTLAGRFCRDHKCDGDDNLNRLTQKLIGKLGSCQAKNRAEENTLVAILKSLSNFRRINDNVLDKIIHCAKDKNIHPRIRVAALETFLADAGKPKLKKAALAILKNHEEDAEIRIKAYLVIAQSPCGEMANALRDLLATEPVNQVGSFIVSHLRNIRASTNPNKELAKQHLGLLRSSKKFPVDIRRFSFNTELSYAINTLGMAASVETNVIYSQDSFIPRSANLNLTTEIFGHTFNFLEVGVRQENLDRVVEHYLGPRGVLQKSSASDILEHSKHEIQHIVDKIKQRLEKTKRGRRDVSENDITKFAKSVKLASSKLDHALDVDLSFKIFGSEIGFITVNEDIQKLNPDAIIDKIFDTLDAGINNAKHFEHNVGRHVLFLDMEVAYPTSVGLPLKLTVVGTGALQLASSGNVDMRKILQDPKNGEFVLNLIPSANIEVVAAITVEAPQIETGLQITSSLHTATGSELAVKLLNNGKGIDVKLGLPIQKQDIITVRHDIVFATRELGHETVEVPLKFTGQRKEHHGCFDQLSQIIGLTFCGEVGVPVNSLPGVPLAGVSSSASPFPLSGPAKLSVRIDREDSKDYHFRALLQDDKPDVKKLEIIFDTPKSKINRRVSLQLEAGSKPDYYVTAVLNSPIKSAKLEGRIINNQHEMSVNGVLSYDKIEYSAKFGAKVSGNEASSRYTPLIEFKTPQQKGGAGSGGYNVKGSILVEKSANGRKMTFDNVQVEVPNTPPVSIQGHLGKNGPTYSVDMTIKQEQRSGSVKGSLTFESPENIKLDAEIHNSLNPNMNLHIIAEHKRSPGVFDNKLEITHGQDLKTSKNKLIAESKGKYHYESSNNFEISSKNKVEYALFNVHVKADTHISPKAFTYDLEGKYEKVKVKSELDAKINQKAPGDYSVKFEAEALDNKIKIKSSRDVISPTKSKLHNEFESKNHKFEMSADVVHQFRSNDVNAQFNAVVKMSGHAQPINIKQGLVFNPHTIEAHSDVKDGEHQLVDVQFKSNRAGNANGAAKISIDGIVAANGNLVVKDGKGTGSVVVDLKKLNRKLKGDATFTLAKSVYNAHINLLLDADKDATKKITINTNNKLTENSVESKSMIDILSNVLEVNVHGNLKGKILDGTMKGDFDVTLPTGHFISGKVDRELHIVNNVVNAKGKGELEYRITKSSKGYKVEVAATVKDTNIREHVVDIHGNVHAIKDDGKDVKVDFSINHNHNQNGQRHTTNSVKITGSLMKHPLEGLVNADYSKNYGNYKTQVKCGSGSALSVTGKYDYGHTVDNKYTAENQFQLDLPFENYKSIKLQNSLTSTRPKTENDVFEYTTSNTIGVNDKTAKMDASVRGNHDQGSGKVSVTLSNGQPITVSANYKRSGPDAMQISADIEQHTKDNKNIRLGVTINKPDADQVSLKLTALTPVENARTVDLTVSLIRADENHKFTTEVALAVNDKKYRLTQELVLSETSPSFDLKVINPENKQSRIAAKFNRVGDEHFSGEVIVQNIKDFSVEASGDATIKSPDEFVIKFNINSEKLNFKNVHVEIINKPLKSGKRIQFTAKSGNDNLLSGSTSYNTRTEAGKLIVEGSGSFKVKDESKTGNFKFIRKYLDPTKDGEKGIEVSLNGALGSRNVVGELIFTNKQFHFRKQYCEETKNCAHIDVTSKTSSVELKEFHHVLEVSVDLRKLGLKHEFGVKSVFERKDLNLEHIIDLYFQANEKTAYQYKVYAHPTNAGVQLTLPKRIVAVEALIDITTKVPKKVGSSKIQLSIYLDKKNHPEKKTILSASTDVTRSDRTASFVGELKFAHPALGKDLILSTNVNANKEAQTLDVSVDVDVFAKKNQKITVVAKVVGHRTGEKGYNVTGDFTVESKGQGFRLEIREHLAVNSEGLSMGHFGSYTGGKHPKECALLLVVNPKHFEILINSLSTVLIHIDGQIQVSKNLVHIKNSLKLLGVDPRIQEIEIKDMNTFKYHLTNEVTKDHVNLVAGLILGQLAEVKSDAVIGGAKLDLYHVTIRLDDAHFLKSDYGANIENLKKLMEVVRKTFETNFEALKKFGESGKDITTETFSHLKDELKKSLPNFKPLLTEYKDQLNKLREEIVSDQVLHDANEFIKKVFGAAATTLQELLARLMSVFDKLYEALYENFSKIVDAFNKELVPQLKASISRIMQAFSGIVKHITDIVFLYIAKLADVIKAHEADFKKIATAITEVGQDVGRAMARAFSQIRIEIVSFVNAIVEQVKALPITDIIKEKYAEVFGSINVPEHIAEIFQEFLGTVKGVLPTKELQDVVQVTYDYIIKKLKSQKVDDAEAIKQIYTSILKAIQSVMKLIQANGGVEGIENVLNNNIPISFGTIAKIPAFITIQLSPLRYILSDDLPSIRELLYTYRPRLQIWDNIPPYKLNGMLIDGQHIFTFDERHITFPGQCDYILVQDFQDQNFSLTANLVKGELHSITLHDKSGSLTVKKDGTLSKNGHGSEYPAGTDSLQAWRRYHSINLKSDAGIRVTMGPDLRIVAVGVSGFYRNRVRGLLGNGNDEQYDDLILPSGKVAKNEAEFGNAYKVGGSCRDVATVDHSTNNHNTPACSQLFSGDSTLRFCFPGINSDNFRQACEHAVAGGKNDAACLIATGYTYACRDAGFPVELPATCVKCTNTDGKKIDFEDSVSVKSPHGKADVVILVEQKKYNEPILKDLVVPLVQQLTADLGAKGIKDVQFSLSGYGGQTWPAHFTNGGKIQYNGKPTTMKFVDEKKPTYLHVGNEKIDATLVQLQKIAELVKKDLGLTDAHIAAQEISDYPFRPDASRTVIVVQSQNCYSYRLPFGLSTLSALIMELKYKNSGVTFNVITPLTDLEVKGKDAKLSKSVVGFNADGAFTLADGKKKSIDGNADLRSELYHHSDSCIDFAEATHGAVFSSNAFKEAKGPQKKQFVHVASKVITEQLAGVEFTRDCTCGLKKGFIPQMKCQVTSRQVKGAASTKASRG